MTLLHKITAAILDEPVPGIGTLRQGMREQFSQEENASLTDEEMNRMLVPWARAALNAIWSPTVEQIHAGQHASNLSFLEASCAYRAMITQALKEGEGPRLELRAIIEEGLA